MRFEVPQFIEIEDKIIGPLTWKQFVYLGGGVGILVILKVSTPFMVFVLLGIPFGALAASLAFHKVNSRPFSIFLESLFNYLTKKKLYLWRKADPLTIIEKSDVVTSDLGAASTQPDVRKKSISSLANKLEYEIHN